MRKPIKYINSILASSLILMASACDPDGVDSLSFNVRTEGGVTTVKTDEEIHFLIDGNADYITFTNDENGVAHVVDKYILGKNKQRQLEWKKNLRLSNITAKLYKYTHRLQHK